MANEEQLSILKQGVDVWNKWREENPDVTRTSGFGLRDDFGIDLRDLTYMIWICVTSTSVRLISAAPISMEAT